MKYSDFSQPKNEEEVKSHILTLFTLAAADQEFHDKEIEMIYSIAQEYGVSDDKLVRLSKEDPDFSNYQKPQTARKKIEYIFDLILVMMTDGEMTRDELITAKKIGSLMDISESDFEEILEMMNDFALITNDKNKIVLYIHYLLGHRI